MNSTNYFIAQLLFVALTLTFIGLFVRELFAGINASKALREKAGKYQFRIIAGLVAWLLIASALSLSGILHDFSSFPPPMMIVLIFPLVSVILILIFSNTLTEILTHIPSQNLIRIQAFRVFVEILLWMLFIENLLPVQMSFEGRNFDILAGLTAPLIAYLFHRNKKVMIGWNFIGLGLLFNIVTIAVLSFPTPFRVFMNEPANTIVAYFPIVFLPAFLVPLAYTLHFFSLKQLLRKG
jgi:hypothetical protein